jgi:methionyl-tRNA synthetase
MEKYAFQQGLQEVFRVIRARTSNIDETSPWALAKGTKIKKRGSPPSCIT